MYIQITNRCNMSCDHCCFDCKKTGKDMTVNVFEAACKLAASNGSHISIGGGEPTLHKRFWEFLGLAMYYQDDGNVWLATNGSNTRISLALAGMAKGGAIGCALSIDDFHDPIDPQVVQAFTKGRHFHDDDYREIRNTAQSSGGVSNVGRAITHVDNYEKFDQCACDGTFIDPHGRIFQCGCMKVQWGTVFNPEFPNDSDEEPEKYGGCSVFQN